MADSRGRWVLAVAVMGSALGFMDATVVNVALPDLGRDLDADVADVQWVVSGYTLSLGSWMLLGGGLGDRYGRRRIFAIGVILFTVMSLVCALSPNAAFLIGARVLQGVGAALVTPGSLAIIEAEFAEQERSRAIGAWSGLSGIGAAVGPLVGGYLVEAGSWRAVFYLNVPVGVAVVIAALRHVPESRDPTVRGRLDWAGSVLVTLALAGVSTALIEAPESGASRLLVAGAVVVGVSAAVGFVLTERRKSNPILPPDIFGSGQFVSANLITLAVYAALGGVMFLLVIHLQTTLRYSPLAAGAALLPITALMLVLSPGSGALAQRIGPRPQLTAGPALLAVAMVLMAFIDRGDSFVVSVLPAVLVFGLGLSAIVAPVTATALASVDRAHAGIASGVNNAVARVAGLAAVTVLPVMAGLSGPDFRRPEALERGFPIAMIACAVLAMVGGLVAALTIHDDVLTRRDTGP